MSLRPRLCPTASWAPALTSACAFTHCWKTCEYPALLTACNAVTSRVVPCEIMHMAEMYSMCDMYYVMWTLHCCSNCKSASANIVNVFTACIGLA